MDCYTRSITVSIRSGYPVGMNESGSNIIRKNIRIPIIKPTQPRVQVVAPLFDLTNDMRSKRNDMFFDKSTTCATLANDIPTSPRTKANSGEVYTIQRTASATRLYLIEDSQQQQPLPGVSGNYHANNEIFRSRKYYPDDEKDLDSAEIEDYINDAWSIMNF